MDLCESCFVTCIGTQLLFKHGLKGYNNGIYESSFTALIYEIVDQSSQICCIQSWPSRTGSSPTS